MNLHEYQAKQLFAEYGLPVSKGFAVDNAEDAAAAADKLGGNKWVVKAQVHAGGRGKAGGVKLVSSKEEIKAFAEKWLGKNLVTYQTDANGQPVSKILVETCTDIAQELYLGAVVDRSSRRIVFMASTEGGVEIEKVAEETPEKILRAVIDPLVWCSALSSSRTCLSARTERCTGKTVHSAFPRALPSSSLISIWLCWKSIPS
jgi:succinyl-CoA synthetase beta subunit